MTAPHVADAELAVATSGDYLAAVATWLSGRRAYGQPMLAHPVLRRRLAEAIVAHRGAVAVLDAVERDAGPADVAGIPARAAAECARICADIHAGAGVFDARPDLVRRLSARLHRPAGSDVDPPWPGPLGRLHPALAESLAASVIEASPPPHRANPLTAQARDLVAILEKICPTMSTTLLDDLVVAEALGRLLPPGLAARVLTHRLVVRAYAAGPLVAPAATRMVDDLRTGVALAAIAVTEPSAGSDLRGLTAAVRRDGRGLRLDAVKTYIAGGADCDLLVLAARYGDRPVLVLVDANRPDVKRRPLVGRAWRGVGFAQVELRGYSLSEEDIYPGDGGTALVAGLMRERMVLGAQQIAYAWRWIADVPAERRVDLTWRLSTARALLEQALARADGDLPAMVDCSMAKLACCAAAADVAAARTSAHTAAGSVADVDELLDDEASARACTFAGGTSDINLALVEGLIPSLLSYQEGGWTDDSGD